MHQPLRHWAWYVLGDDSVFVNGMLQFWIAKGAGADDDEAVPFCRTRGSDDVGLRFGFDSAAAKAASAWRFRWPYMPFLPNRCFSWAWQIWTSKLRDESGERLGCTGIRPSAIFCIMAARTSNSASSDPVAVVLERQEAGGWS